MKFTLLIPTLNEIEGIKVIMPKIKKEWVDEIIVVDGHSTDGTKEWFEENGFRVLTQKRPGGPGAWWEGFAAATGDIIIPFSPDGNSLPEKIPELVSKMKENYDMVIVSRYKDGAKSYDDDWLSAFANSGFNKIINFLFGSNYTDALVMYRAFKKNLLQELGFSYDTGLRFNKYKSSMFELILSIRCVKGKRRVGEIPGDEPPNVGRQESRAHPTKIAKIYNGFLMMYYILQEFFYSIFRRSKNRANQRSDIKYHLAEDTIDQSDIDALIEWLKTYPRLTKGPLTPQFEEKWSKWLGRKYSVFCNSGSSANLLMYHALLLSGRLKNKKIIVPSVGWVTTVSPAIQLGFEPIMCEADKDTFGLDLNHLESLLQKHSPSSVILVQVLGVPHKMDEIAKLKEKYGFFLLEDACAAMGSSYQGRNVGTFGDMSSFSLYFGHQISTIEGGLVSTDDKQFNDLLLMLRSHGWGKDLDEATHHKLITEHDIDNFHAPFVFYEPGLNVRSTDLNAFIGIRQIDKMEWLIERRGANHALYRKVLGDRFYYQTPESDCVICSISFGFLAKDTEERRKIVSALDRASVETRIFSAGNLGLHPFWYKRYGKNSFPMADRIHYSGLLLPNNPSLKENDIEAISKIVLESAS